MTLIICVTAVCVLLSVFDIRKMRKIDTGRVITLALYSVLMISAIIILCAFTGLENFSLAEILIPNF